VSYERYERFTNIIISIIITMMRRTVVVGEPRQMQMILHPSTEPQIAQTPISTVAGIATISDSPPSPYRFYIINVMV